MNSGNQEQIPVHFENLHSEVSKRVEQVPEDKKDADTHKQAIHQVVGEKLGSTKTTQSDKTSDANIDLSPESKAKVDELVSHAMSKDLDDAISEVKKANDPAVVDAFHDLLVNELYDSLVSEGKLKTLK